MGFALLLIIIITGIEISHFLTIIINTFFNDSYLIISFLTYISVISALIFICYLAQKDTYNRIINIMIKEKNIEKFIKKCEYTFAWAIDRVLISKLAIKLCELYIQQEKYKLAFETLKKTNLQKNTFIFNNMFLLPKSLKLEYYLKLIFLNIKFNNIVEAQMAAENGHDFIELFFDNEDFALEIKYTLALLEKAKGDKTKALELIESAFESIEINSEFGNILNELKTSIISE